MKPYAFGIMMLMVAASPVSRADTVTVVPSNSVIVVPSGTNDAKMVKAAVIAAAELAKHLKLITGADIQTVSETNTIAGKYRFSVGIALPGDHIPFAPEEARSAITAEATYLYGDSNHGAQFAVYDFLENELGVRWIQPGDRGIACRLQNPLVLQTGAFTWKPALGFRNIRASVKVNQLPDLTGRPELAEFTGFLVYSKEEHNRYANDVVQWRTRMKMGGHLAVPYGHNFTTWWKQYGQAHPEYFAMKADGKREPENVTGYKPKVMYTADNPKGFQNIKLCPSSPALVEQLIQNWLADRSQPHGINLCENDSPPVNFCTCKDCVALDVPIKGQEGPFGAHMTDRYVFLANQVAKKAREHDPEAFTVMYAYNQTEQPPRKQRLEPNVVVVVVPTAFEIKKIKALFQGWRDAGATRLAMRSNHHLYYFAGSMPTGFEKYWFDFFQTVYRENLIGVDNEGLTHNWGVMGLADYVEGKALSDPTKPFEYWEAQYYSSFGPATDDVRKYFQYWRQEVWEKRLEPNMSAISEQGKYFNFVRGVMWSIDKYYRESDFDATDRFLEAAQAREGLSASEKERLLQLALANTHARLVFKAVAGKGADKQRPALDLIEFREQHKKLLPLSWVGIFATEIRFGDITGIKMAMALREYPLPWLATSLSWKFRLDPQDDGVRANWAGLTYDQIATAKDWEPMRTSNYWEQPYEWAGSAELLGKLKLYDGIGWYVTQSRIPSDWKGRTVLLYFGAVDESCQVYVNGRLAGQREWAKAGDESAPFTIRIDPCIDWGRETQTLSVRVEDKGGFGGIWRPVWVVSKQP